MEPRPTFSYIPNDVVREMVINNPSILNPFIRTSKRYNNLLKDYSKESKEALISQIISQDLVTREDSIEVLRILRDYLTPYISKKTMSMGYYYQYEFDSNLSEYERLMNDHAITIGAYSLEEANLINIILHILFAGHIGVLEMYEDSVTYDMLTIDDGLSMYNNYYSDTIKPFSNEYGDLPYERLSNGLCLYYYEFTSDRGYKVRINTPIVYTRERVLQLIEDPKVFQYFTDPSLKFNDGILAFLLEMTPEERSTQIIKECDTSLSDED